MTNRVTIKTLAQDLGVSHMTVSRALSGSPQVTAETRALVLARAEALGYVRSAAARAIRGGATRIVGLLLPNLVNEFYARFADALAAACEAAALQLIIHLTRDDPASERRAILRLREVDASAVLMVPAPMTAAVEPSLHGAMTVLHLIRQRDGQAALLVDDGPAIAQAVDLLVARGHRRIGYIGADQGLSSGRARLAAFASAADRHGIENPHADIVTGVPSFRMGQNGVSELLVRPYRVSAVICGGFEISNGALDACLRRGLVMPADLAFVGYGDPPHYSWISGGITTIGLPVVEMAQAAVSKLSPATEPRQNDRGWTFPASLLLRGSI